MIEIEVEPGLTKPLPWCSEDELRAAKVRLMGEVLFTKREGDADAMLAAMDTLTQVTDYLSRRHGEQPPTIVGPLFEEQ